jgi:hypothetical protein
VTQPKPKILFAFYTLSEAHRDECIEIVKTSYIGPLDETGLADYDIFWYGPWMIDNWILINWFLFCKCAEYQPDVIMLINGWQPEYEDLAPSRPRLITFYLIRKLLGIKITAVWTDQAFEAFLESDILTRLCDLAFTHENKIVYQNYSAFPNKYFLTNQTSSTKLFQANPMDARDIDLGFSGGLTGYKNQRTEGVAALRQHGLNVTLSETSGQGKGKLSNEEYATFCKRSKIVLNWSQHISGAWFQAKGRIFEATLAGALLLCEECEAVNHFFEPYVDYVPFSNTEELVDRAAYYLTHEEERLKIAVQGHRKAIEKYSAAQMWKDILKKILCQDLYREKEAVEGLRNNASINELKVARFLQSELKKEFPQFDPIIIDDAVSIIERGHKSFVRKLPWIKFKNRWPMMNRQGKTVIRKIFPSFISSDMLRSLVHKERR